MMSTLTTVKTEESVRKMRGDKKRRDLVLAQLIVGRENAKNEKGLDLGQNVVINLREADPENIGEEILARGDVILEKEEEAAAEAAGTSVIVRRKKMDPRGYLLLRDGL
jgi:hypothetical protein